MKKYKYIFFDLDHTLWDFELNAEEVLKELFENYSLHNYASGSPLAFVATFHRINTSLWNAFEQGIIPHQYIRENRFRMVLEDLKIPCPFETVKMNDDFLNMLPKKSALIPGAREVLDFALEKGYLMSIISNGFITVQESKLRSSGIRHYFEHVVTHEIANANKPDPRIFRYAMDIAGTRVKDCLMVGDSWNADVMGAGSVGMDVAFFAPLQSQVKTQATFHIRTLTDLKAFL